MTDPAPASPLADWAAALLLGVIEGLTEFLPVSSTGHLIAFGELFGFQGPPGKVFEVVIQLGAILAVVLVNARMLAAAVISAPVDPKARRFLGVILLAFLPAAAVGALLHGFIKAALFNPLVVAIALIVGGVVLIVIERVLPEPRHFRVWELPWGVGLRIGLFQCLAMIPGTSRAGATIVGALLSGVERRAAAEFSFLLAIPTMIGATAYDLYKNWSLLSPEGWGMIAAGFAVAFVVALAVVRSLVGFVSRHGFAPFGWYRIALGIAILAALAI